MGPLAEARAWSGVVVLVSLIFCELFLGLVFFGGLPVFFGGGLGYGQTFWGGFQGDRAGSTHMPVLRRVKTLEFFVLVNHPVVT